MNQVSLAHVSLRYICKLLLAGVVAGAALPGFVYSCSAPPLTALLLIVQVGACLRYEPGVCRDGFSGVATREFTDPEQLVS